MSAEYDVLIVGGGLVGATLACALAGSEARLAVVEPVVVNAETQPSYDDRSTALSATSRRVFEALDLWPALQARAEPIREIHVSDRGRFGFARLSASRHGMDALGHVIGNRELGQILPARAAAVPGCDFISPATVEDVQVRDDAVEVAIREGDSVRRCRTRLLVVADGARSQTRARLGIETRETDYGQVAVVANVTPERAHRGWAYERFMSDGALALLPGPGGRCGLIWTVPSESVSEVLSLDDAAFLARLQKAFGFRLGRFLRVGTRLSHPLISITARRYSSRRALVVGNAAHTLHPVAGQGFNLALRDIATLAELIHEALRAGRDPGGAELLARYEALRSTDFRRTAGFTDGLIRLFSNALPGVTLARNLGLIGFDLFPPAKQWLVREASGQGGRLPRLARGLPLVEDRV